MVLLKGSVIRKRYVLVLWESGAEKNDRYIYNSYQVKRKYRNNNFSILMCNQMNKNTICDIIEKRGGKVIAVSGTIKKCKSHMDGIVNNQVHT
jgi:uncharacterized protein (DUF1330 family)